MGNETPEKPKVEKEEMTNQTTNTFAITNQIIKRNLRDRPCPSYCFHDRGLIKCVCKILILHARFGRQVSIKPQRAWGPSRARIGMHDHDVSHSHPILDPCMHLTTKQ
jgi:hypothetical protein